MSSKEGRSVSMPIAGGESQESEEQSDSQQAESNQRDQVLEAIDREVSNNSVVLYMKGTPEQPMCGFSARAASIIDSYDVPFHAVNVLSDSAKREGIKEYGDWPTIPQLYLEGELIGGSDIMAKLYESGELDEMIEEVTQ